jgi:hypothetical protein
MKEGDKYGKLYTTNYDSRRVSGKNKFNVLGKRT